MPATYEIKKHIAAVQQTRKITGAMQVVSSTRMHHVMQHIESNHRYFERVQESMKQILLSAEGNVTHPYLAEHEGKHRTYLVIGGEKGMAGDYNSNLLNFAMQHIQLPPQASLITIGNVADEYFLSHNILPDVKYDGIAQDPTLARARELTSDILSVYDRGITDEVWVVYTSFYGDTKNQPVMRRLLPIRFTDYKDVPWVENLGEIIYTPSPQAVFDMLVPQYLVGIVFGVLVQSYASEHFARMNAMQAANKSAGDMLTQLQTTYNLARQSAITREITEITGGAEMSGEGNDSKEYEDYEYAEPET